MNPKYPEKEHCHPAPVMSSGGGVSADVMGGSEPQIPAK